MARRKRRHRTVSPHSAFLTAQTTLSAIGEEVQAHEVMLAQLVTRAAVAGASGAAIAGELGVSRATLYRRFGPILREGRAA